MDRHLVALSRLIRHTTPMMLETPQYSPVGQATNPTCAFAAVKPAWRHNARSEWQPDQSITFEHRPGDMQLPKVAAKSVQGRVQLRWWTGGGEHDTLCWLQMCHRGMGQTTDGLYASLFLDCCLRPHACFCTLFGMIPEPSDVASRICHRKHPKHLAVMSSQAAASHGRPSCCRETLCSSVSC